MLSGQFDAHRRPIVDVTLRLPFVLRHVSEASGFAPAPLSGPAILDTGADRTAIDVVQADRAGLKPVDFGTIRRYDQQGGAITVPLFDVELEINGLGRYPIAKANGLHLRDFGIVALVGADIMKGFTLVCNYPAKRVTLRR